MNDDLKPVDREIVIKEGETIRIVPQQITRTSTSVLVSCQHGFAGDLVWAENEKSELSRTQECAGGGQE